MKKLAIFFVVIMLSFVMIFVLISRLDRKTAANQKKQHDEYVAFTKKITNTTSKAMKTQSSNLKLRSTLRDIQKRGTLRVGTEPGFLPFEMYDKNGELVGFDIDLAEQMAESMGVEVQYVPTAWDDILDSLIANKFDIIMSGMTHTQDRNLHVNFTDPYLMIGQSILISKKLEGKIHSYKDLNSSKYRVASKLATSGEKATQKYIPGATYSAYDSEHDGVRALIDGKVDAFVYDLPFNAVEFGRNFDTGKIAHLDVPFTKEPLAWAIRSGDVDFLNWLNGFLKQSKYDGLYDTSYERWFKSDDWISTIE